MLNEKIFILLNDLHVAEMFARGVLRPAGYDVVLANSSTELTNLLYGPLPDLVIIEDTLEDTNALELGGRLNHRYPSLPMVLYTANDSAELVVEAMRVGFSDILRIPLRVNDVLQVVRGVLQRHKRLNDWVHLQTRRNTRSLEQRLNNLEALQKIGRQVTSLLKLDDVLAAVVDAAVNLTQAEEGSLLLIDESTGELYMRASRNFQEEFVQTFRLPTQDSLAGQVIATGEPVLIDDSTPQKIKTSYLVHALIYVPIVIREQVIGVLGVDNRQLGHRFTDYHLLLVSALAEYAAIAIQNARLYARSENERSQLEAILTGVEDGVIVVDPEGSLLLINHSARQAFGLIGDNLDGKPLSEVIHNAELLEIAGEEKPVMPCRMEITLEDGRVMNTQFTPIPGVGLVTTMQDITHLKELDRIKSDFVNTVSHDLRSPLTAILGYVELLERVGPVNDMQREFIRRVQLSVQSITALINDLLDLGRIEAGFDSRKEIVPLGNLIQYSVDGLMMRTVEKSQDLQVSIPDDLPRVLGNPVRLRQLVNNLLGNAIKYTQVGGKIRVQARAEGEQVIFQVSDNGPGIPVADQPYIFDKFYRASNAPDTTQGTGLGLAIVKSIVDNHQGRVWADSTPGEGSTFTVVLPAAQAGEPEEEFEGEMR